MRADFAVLIIDALPADTRRTFTSATLGGLRMRKDANEYAELKMNAGIADRAIRPGITEKELSAEIRAHFHSEGVSPQFWLVGAGGNGAFPHHSASDAPFRTATRW